MTMIEVCCWH